MIFASINPYFKSIFQHIPEKIRPQFIGSLVIAILVTLIIFSEYGLIPEALRKEFLVYKIASLIMYFIYLVLLIKSPDSKYKNVLYVAIALFYSVTSSFYRPLYIIGIFDIMIFFIFLFPMKKKEFWILSTLGIWVYTFAITYRFPNIPDSQVSLDLADHILIGIGRYAILIVAFYFFIKARDSQLQAERRFGLVGRHAARVAHDIKGMLSAPLLILDNLKEQNKTEANGEIQTSIHLLSEQMEQIHSSLLELSRLCSLDQLPLSRFSLSDGIQGVKSLYLKNLEDVDFMVSGDLNFYCDRSIVTSLFSNLINNSLNQFKKKLCKTRRIEITVETRQDKTVIIYKDNGGGFSPQAMQSINKQQPYSIEGSGIGLQLIRECVSKLNGSVGFDNFENGARTTVILRKSDLVSLI